MLWFDIQTHPPTGGSWERTNKLDPPEIGYPHSSVEES